MGLFEQFPYQNFHELNLDWLIQQINMVKESVVLSVNGQTGEVILYPEAFVRLPDISDTTTWSFYRYVNNKAEGVQFINGQPMQRIDDLNRYDIYDAGNPPPYPVTAVNGQTGDVVIAVPVQSVNGQTGNIILYQNASIEFPAINTDSWEMWRETDTNQALGVKFSAGQPMKRVDNGLEYTVYDSQNQPPYPVESVAGLTGAVAILNTQIVTDQGQQKIQIVFPVNTVDGQTGSVNTWAYTNNATTKLPIAAPADLWNLTRDINSGTVGIRFSYDSVNGSQAFLTFNDGTNPETALRLLTPADIPSSSGVVSINGMAGVVDLYADAIQMSSSDNTLVKDAINTNAAAISNNTQDIATNSANISNNTTNITANTNRIRKLNTATQITDYNDTTETGLYKAAVGISNSPPVPDLYTIYTFAYNLIGAELGQIAFGMSNGYVYTRTRRQSVWSTWKEIAFSANTPKYVDHTAIVSGGYFIISTLPAGSVILNVQELYIYGEPLNLSFTVSGNLVYVRTGTGTPPDDNTSVNVRILYI